MGKTLSFAPCNDEFYFWNHPSVYVCVLVTANFGKAVGNIWHEMALARVHGHREDCVKRCDCDDCHCCHAHNADCQLDDCVLKRLNAKAPAMSGQARVALMGWLSLMTEQMASCDSHSDWSREDKAAYLAKLVTVAAHMVEKGKESVHSPLIHCLGKQIQDTVKNF